MSAPKFSEGLQKFACPHTAHTVADKDGYAICTKCGGAISVRLTRERFDAYMAKALTTGRTR